MSSTRRTATCSCSRTRRTLTSSRSVGWRYPRRRPTTSRWRACGHPRRSPTGRRAPTAREEGASTSPTAASTTMGIRGRTTAGSSSSASPGDEPHSQRRGFRGRPERRSSPRFVDLQPRRFSRARSPMSGTTRAGTRALVIPRTPCARTCRTSWAAVDLPLRRVDEDSDHGRLHLPHAHPLVRSERCGDRSVAKLDVFTSSTTLRQTDHNVTAPPGTVRGRSS